MFFCLYCPTMRTMFFSIILASKFKPVSICLLYHNPNKELIDILETIFGIYAHSEQQTDVAIP